MDENNKVIEQMLKQEGFEATDPAKQAIVDFSTMYAKKLITKCMIGGKTTLNLEDIRFTYETMNRIHSLEYDAELEERRMKLVKYMNKNLNEQKFQKSPADVNTVSLYPNSENPHMRTSWQYQIAFENS